MVHLETNEDLILHYLAGEATPEECKQLQELCEQDSTIAKNFQNISRTWKQCQYSKKWNNIDVNVAWENITKKRNKKKNLYIRLASVAAIACLLVFFPILWQYNTLETEIYPPQKTLSPSEKEEVHLILSDGKRLTVGNVLERQYEEQGSLIQSDSSLIIYQNINQGKDSIEHFNQLVVPRGCEYRLQLSDGTIVHLNADSRLKFPVIFTQNERKVFLEGEGYFEVTHNKQHPFIVVTHEFEIKVLGTDFNVNAYHGDSQQEVTLVNGKVSIHLPNEKTSLTPNRQYRYDTYRHTGSVHKVNVAPYISWKEGILAFDGTSLREVANKLERWYNIQFVFMSERLEKIRFSGQFTKYENLSYILKLICETTEVKSNLQENTVIIYQ